jgi:hypothetical protein
MNKDVIYIDVEDDITAIIGKVKDAKQKIVALVPPKRIGVLQSTVNLRLLARAASQANKHLVLISNNPALIALAAAAKLPVAKNLQSKPEIAEIAALDIDDGEDVIDGAELPVGELAQTAGLSPQQIVAVHNPAIDNAIQDNLAEVTSRRALPPAPGQQPGKARSKSGIKVPNFSDFRKKLVVIIAAGILLIGFLVWGVFFAPRATVQITARTSDSSVNNNITLGNDLTTDLAANTIKTTTQQIKKAASIEFEATGTKDVGEKATGTINVKNCDSNTSFTIPANTSFTANSGQKFTNTAAVMVPGFSGSASACRVTGAGAGQASVVVSATAIGDEYNLSARSYAIDGISGDVYANGSDMAGGSRKKVTVVAAEDIQKATEQLKQQDTAAIKKELSTKLGTDVVVVDQTFKTDQPAPVSTPAVDQEIAAGVKPKLASETTYSLSAVDKNELNDYLDAHYAKQLEGLNDQRTYENGLKNVTFTNLNPVETGFTGNIVATAKIGPKIEDSVIKNSAKGKRYGEIQSSLEAIQGVDNVDVKFWPFWVSSAPNDVKKINVEFKLHESK